MVTGHGIVVWGYLDLLTHSCPLYRLVCRAARRLPHSCLLWSSFWTVHQLWWRVLSSPSAVWRQVFWVALVSAFPQVSIEGLSGWCCLALFSSHVRSIFTSWWRPCRLGCSGREDVGWKWSRARMLNEWMNECIYIGRILLRFLVWKVDGL